MGIVSFANGWVKTTSAYWDLVAWRAAQGVTMQADMDLGTSLTNSLSDAMINQAQGAVSLASQAAAKRLGITLPSSSSSTGSTGTAATGTTPNPASSVTVQRASGTVNSPYGNNYAAQNITGALASLDAIVAGTTPATAVGTKSLTSYGSNYAAQNITGFLANLDAINTTPIPPVLNVTA